MAIFKYNQYEIYYDLQGEPSDDVIVLLNGIMMSTLSWETFMPALTKEVRVLRFDMLDQGQSTKMNTPYTQDLQVDVLNALLNHLQIDNATLVGISYGGSIALQFAVKYPHNLSKMIVFNAVAKTSKWLKAIGDGWNEVALTRNGSAYYHITIPMIYSPNFYDNQYEWMERRKGLLIPIFSTPLFLDAMIRLTKSAENHDITPYYSNILTPSLIVASEHDYLTPPFEQNILHKNLTHSHLITLNDCGHASMYEKPALFVAIILGYVKEVQNKYKI